MAETNEKKPVTEVAQERLREYAEAVHHEHYLARQVPRDHPDRKAARRKTDELEAALIGDITANAPNGAVERTAFRLYDGIDALRELAEDLTDAIAAAGKVPEFDGWAGGHLGTTEPELAARIVTVAESQEEYLTVRAALVTSPDYAAPRGYNTVVMAFRPDEAQRRAIAAGEDLYVSLLTFGQPQQPIMVMVGKKTAAGTFGVPVKEEEDHADVS